MKPGDLVTLGVGLTQVPVYSAAGWRSRLTCWWKEGEVGVFIDDVGHNDGWAAGFKGNVAAHVLFKGMSQWVTKDHLRVDGEVPTRKISHARPKKNLTPR